jgi:two-component system, NtrC family, sensor kinase
VDRQELELALVNLVVNAKDAMSDGGQLSIAAKNVCLGQYENHSGLTGDFVALSVTDVGSGIPDDILPHVFEPFFTTKPADKGTGLGLSQVYAFAQRSGGTVDIRSELMRGTTVTIYLPRAKGQPERQVAKFQNQDLKLGQGTILVVEDNSQVRQVAISLLEELGYLTIEADSAAAAIAAFSNTQRTIDLVFSDVVLAEKTDGLALARTIRAQYPDVPVILTTGYAKAFTEEPEFPVLRKPYQISMLSEMIRKVLGLGNEKKSASSPISGLRDATCRDDSLT